MQPEGPYRFTEVLGECQVGRAWAALDGQDRPVTVATLDGAAAGDQRWREAFTNAANVLAQTPGGHRYVNADFTAGQPWVAYPSEEDGAAERLFGSLGMDYQRTATAEILPPPPPVSAPPQPVSSPPQLPWSPQPWAMAPQQPVSGAPSSGAPVSPGMPVPVIPAQATAPDPLTSTGGPRIAPVARPPRSRTGLWIGGVVMAAVLAGGAGLLAGRALADGDEPSTPSASASPALYEATQLSLNKAKFDAELMPLAEPWLGEVGGCAINTEKSGPGLADGEKQHVFCRYLGVSLHFAAYESAEKKEAARAFRQQMGIIGRALAPGMREASQATGGVSGATGNYVEYAGNGQDGRPVCGIWWGRDDKVAAIYMETPCGAGLGGNWDALRDLWQRHS
ncbi:hypothetical protein [Micromonospora maritima]|uniref:hypothetical protein n=1 Tax=Micromonospora maritima TaxID=986711 RepID=UPI00157BF677|nr:hypothetical protein [Micromonospora maritima]